MERIEGAPKLGTLPSLGRPDRRQGYRIAPEFQSRFRLLMLLFAFVIALMFTSLSATVAHGLENPGFFPRSGWVPLGFLTVSVAMGLVIIRLCDRISHRLCGPMVPILRTLEAVRNGERPPPIRLRRTDEFQELAEAVNRALARLDALDDPGRSASPADAAPIGAGPEAG